MIPFGMTIQLMHKEKRRCEVAILKALQEFQEQTGLNVVGIDYDQVQVIGDDHKRIVGASIRVELP